MQSFLNMRLYDDYSLIITNPHTNEIQGSD